MEFHVRVSSVRSMPLLARESPARCTGTVAIGQRGDTAFDAASVGEGCKTVVAEGIFFRQFHNDNRRF